MASIRIALMQEVYPDSSVHNQQPKVGASLTHRFPRLSAKIRLRCLRQFPLFLKQSGFRHLRSEPSGTCMAPHLKASHHAALHPGTHTLLRLTRAGNLPYACMWTGLPTETP